MGMGFFTSTLCIITVFYVLSLCFHFCWSGVIGVEHAVPVERAHAVSVSLDTLMLTSLTELFTISWKLSEVFPSLLVSSNLVTIIEEKKDIDVVFYSEDDDDWKTDIFNGIMYTPSSDTDGDTISATASLAIGATDPTSYVSPTLFHITLEGMLQSPNDATIPYIIEAWSGGYFYLDNHFVEDQQNVQEKVLSNCITVQGVLSELPPCPRTSVQAMLDGRYSVDTVSSIVSVDDSYDLVYQTFFHGSQAASCYRSQRYNTYV